MLPHPGEVDTITFMADDSLPPEETHEERAARLEAHLVAVARHGTTLWANTARGHGGIAGQAMTPEDHGEVTQHIVRMALQGNTITATADAWDEMWPAEDRASMTRLDEDPAPPMRRGPDGRPARPTPRAAV